MDHYLPSHCCHCASELHIRYRKHAKDSGDNRFRLRLVCPSCQTHLLIENSEVYYDESHLAQQKPTPMNVTQPVILPFQPSMA